MSLHNSFSASPIKADFSTLDALEDAQDSQNAWITEEANDVTSASSSPIMDCPDPTTLSSIFEAPTPPTDKVTAASTPLCTEDDQHTDTYCSAALDIFESSLNTSPPSPDDEFGDFQDTPFNPFAQPISASHPNDNSNQFLLQPPDQVPEPLIFRGMGLVQAAYARFDASTRALRRTSKSSKGRIRAQVEKEVDEDGLLGILLDEVEEEAWQGIPVNGVVMPVSFAKTPEVKMHSESATQVTHDMTEEQMVWST